VEEFVESSEDCGEPCDVEFDACASLELDEAVVLDSVKLLFNSVVAELLLLFSARAVLGIIGFYY